MLTFNIEDSFNKELPADPIIANTRRQVEKSCFSYTTPRIPMRPEILHVSTDLAATLGISKEDYNTDSFKNIFSGAEVYPDTRPYAMCYGGHQFGHWAGQLGDGRAINLFETVHKDQRWALQLKGAGETPYSRTADGFAVLRSSIREHLCSEAMYHLGVPTTRSLSLALTGDEVLRDMLYNGNSAYEKGAVVCRVSPSFVRFGNFQILAARRDKETLTALVDYTIKHFLTDIKGRTKQDYLQFFQEVVDRTQEMVLHWQRVGFVHGVMNTDNMSILGLTIDYGPYGWLEDYDKNWTPNTTDAQGKRYRFGHQPQVALWNLVQLANALYVLIDEAKPLEDIIRSYQESFPLKYMTMMNKKLGLGTLKEGDNQMIDELEANLQLTETDMTIFFRNLAKLDINKEDENALWHHISDAFYLEEELTTVIKDKWLDWLKHYIIRLKSEEIILSNEDRRTLMNATNPKYVLRNYMAQIAIDDANKGDYALIDELYTLLQNPYAEQPEKEKWFAKRPEWARNKVGCSMLSCSS